jgi:hypothetical protein
MRIAAMAAAAALFVTTLPAQITLPEGYGPPPQSAAILEKTEVIRLAPDLGRLTPGERQAVNDLLAAGAIMQRLYEEQRHHQSASALGNLQTLHKKRGEQKATADLLQLYRLFSGPIATTLDNKREPFLPVEREVPGKNVYPWGISRDEVSAFLAARPGERDRILAERTVVRRATRASLSADLARLTKYPALAVLHHELREELVRLSAAPEPGGLYALPYAVAWAEQLHEVHRLLNRAAANVEESDPEFARYLRNRARDFLSNDYESGDASWVTGNFQRLNLQIGAYETYDDALFGAKAFHSASLLLRNEEASRELRAALGSIQEIEDALPYEHQKRVRDDIPVGVYEVIADFGQARGTNTATILPNDPLFSRRYGRTILMRENILRHPAIFASSLGAWKAAVAQPFHGDFDSFGGFYRVLWHEIGHYLGVDRDRQGRPLDVALADYADSVEEMKADLVSLFALDLLARKGMLDGKQLRSVQASGIRRTLQNNQPRADQPYQRMQLVQFNYFVEQGLLSFDAAAGQLTIDYAKYPEVVTALLREVLALQHEGDVQKAKAFFDRYTAWRPELHGVVAANIRGAEGPRYRLVRYGALGE